MSICEKCGHYQKDPGKVKGGQNSKRKGMKKGEEGQMRAQAGRKKEKEESLST